MVSVALALGASLAWGASDFLAGLKSRRLAVMWVLLVSQATGLALVLSAALISGAPLPGQEAALLAAGAGLAELVGFAALYRALAIGTMSVVAPISALAALLPIIVGVAAGEAPSAMQGLGMALALTGAMLASIEFGASGSGRRAAAGVGLATVGALDIAANVMFAVALTVGMAAAVSVLGSLYPVATVVLARAILREQLSISQRGGVAAALAGVGLVSLA